MLSCRTYSDYYGNYMSVKQANDVALYLTSEVGYAIIAVSIIAGVYLVASGLYKMASSDDMRGGGKGKRIIIGAMLITFSILISVIVLTAKIAVD